MSVNVKLWSEENLQYKRGYETGYHIGHASFSTLYEGTSIVIPTYNQLYFLKKCIASIVRYSDLPYEIIVVDNGSTDGTVAYLRRMSGHLRYCLLPENRGFAGATNVGLMMAKGTTVMLLNNDTVVTPRWLSNLMTCLLSHEKIGMVGPVTNYIYGPQQIPVTYRTLRGMQRFAAAFNRSDATKWSEAEMLIGYCILMRREVMLAVGYLDEGFKIGNFEDDDYNLRARLLGWQLRIAGDTFIHHYGSVSMKKLGKKMLQVNARNEQFFKEKWGDKHTVLADIQKSTDTVVTGEQQLYPSRAVVAAGDRSAYFIDQGKRRPIVGTRPEVVISISIRELLRWPLGSPIDMNDIKFNARQFVVLPNGGLYCLENGIRRRVVSAMAAHRWALDVVHPTAMSDEELAQFPSGLPIISPPHVHPQL